MEDRHAMIKCVLSSHIDDYSDSDRDDMEDALEALSWLTAADVAAVDISHRDPVMVAQAIIDL